MWLWTEEWWEKKEKNFLWIKLYTPACKPLAHLLTSLSADLPTTSSYTSWVPGLCLSAGRLSKRIRFYESSNPGMTPPVYCVIFRLLLLKLLMEDGSQGQVETKQICLLINTLNLISVFKFFIKYIIITLLHKLLVSYCNVNPFYFGLPKKYE